MAAGFKGLEVVVPGLHPSAVTLPMRRLRWFLRGFSWLLPADLFRLAILGAPIALLWKGPHFISSLHPREQSARIRPAAASISCRPGESVTIEADVVNDSATVWLREGRHGRGYVRLGAHLVNAEDTVIESDYGRAELPHDIPLHAGARLGLVVEAPAASGRYVVRLDMVNEGIAWFEACGSKTAEVELDVRTD